MFCSLIVLVGVAAFQAPPAAPVMGVVEGRVVDAATGEPIRKATVVLEPRSGTPATRPNPESLPRETAAETDANGNFQVRVMPGTYWPNPSRNGYVSAPGAPATVVAVAGETTKGLTLRLNRQGVITGRVLDEDGEPLARVQVQSQKWVFLSQMGRRRLTPMGSDLTNDLGEYRIFGLAPGKYLLAVQDGYRVGNGPLNQAAYGTVFFPGVPDFAGAQAIEVPAGATRQGVDFRLRKVRTVTVSGKLTGLPAAEARRPGMGIGSMVMLVPRNSPLMTGQHSTPVTAQGTFFFPNVPAGPYTLSVGVYGPNQERRTARQPIEVGDRDLANLTLSLEPTLTLNCQVRATDAPSLATMSLSLVPSPGSAMGSVGGRTDAEGRVVLNNLEKEVYRLNWGGLPAGFYVKSVRLGSLEVPDLLDLTAGASGELTVTLEKGTAELTGTVLGAGQKPAAHVQVVALNARQEVARSVQSDEQGHYTLKELAPGDYRLLVLPDLDSTDPDTFDRLAASAVKVTLAASARETRALEVR